jgi:hypothetical protein
MLCAVRICDFWQENEGKRMRLFSGHDSSANGIGEFTKLVFGLSMLMFL